MTTTSAYVFSSASSATTSGAECAAGFQSITRVVNQSNAARFIHGSVGIGHEGVSLEVSYHLNRDGLCILVQAFDLATCKVTLVRERLMLQPGERRLIIVPRGGGNRSVRFMIHRVGDGVQVLTGKRSG